MERFSIRIHDTLLGREQPRSAQWEWQSCSPTLLSCHPRSLVQWGRQACPFSTLCLVLQASESNGDRIRTWQFSRFAHTLTWSGTKPPTCLFVKSTFFSTVVFRTTSACPRQSCLGSPTHGTPLPAETWVTPQHAALMKDFGFNKPANSDAFAFHQKSLASCNPELMCDLQAWYSTNNNSMSGYYTAGSGKDSMRVWVNNMSSDHTTECLTRRFDSFLKNCKALSVGSFVVAPLGLPPFHNICFSDSDEECKSSLHQICRMGFRKQAVRNEFGQGWIYF